jgi:hydrogenase-4 component B
MIINLVFVTGGFYGLFYMKAYKAQKNNLSLHSIAFVLQHASILSACVLQNSLAFLIAWEILAISSFLLIIFERESVSTIRAGINYLVQSHFSIIFLMFGFIWVAHKTNSYDFSAITSYTSTLSGPASLMLYMCFFTGFAIKAGFVPFHTWLPYAHPAAPSHVSGMMSGVIIKIGILGILRMLLLVKTDFTSLGYLILAISVISGLYGVMLAIVQHNLKKLLAYHSIENIGIIGMGIGIGCIGMGTGNQVLLILGFAGALLHTLNHALFKSLLFYTAGNVYQATHTMDIEKLGGLIKKMPQTAALFLIAALAICGIPPFNGFISEFVIYTGIYNWIGEATLVPLVAAILSMTGLVLIGGLAILCFTKAFGVVFLGAERHKLPLDCSEVSAVQLLPLYLLAFIIILIGLFPQVFIGFLSSPVKLFAGDLASFPGTVDPAAYQAMQSISWASWGLVFLVAGVFGLRRFVMSRHKIEHGVTWGCGYVAPNAKQQYTAGSFVRTYTKLFSVFLLSGKDEQEVNGIFPEGGKYQTHPYDKVEKWLIDKPLKMNKSLMGRFLFLHNGRLQNYILYGVIFILSVIAFPLIYNNLVALLEFLKQL